MRRTPTSAYVLTLALALSGSLAEARISAGTGDAAALAQAALNTVTVVDVPADHWAREAVALIVSQGLITGFPDGTFRGDLPLTRYQAALILARALPQLNVQALPVSDQATVQRALTGLQPELAVIRQQVQLLSDMLGSQQAQLTALAAGKADREKVSALEAEVAALRVQVTALTGTYVAVGTQIDALTVKAAQDALGTAPATPVAAASPADVAAQPDVPFTPAAELPSNLKSEQFAVGAFGAVGSVSTQGGVSLDYRFARNTPVYLQLYGQTSLGSVRASGLGLNAAYDFGKAGQDLRPYVYAGLGASVSEAWETTGSATDLYGRVGAGAEYRMADTFSIFGDGYVNYYASNKGIGTGLGQNSPGGAGVGARLGVKVRF